MVKVQKVRLAEVKDTIRDGDVLMFRHGPSLYQKAIAAAGRSDYSHAAMAAWWGDELMVLEVTDGHGGRAVTLESQVKRFPGRYDVFRTNPSKRERYNRRGAVKYMRSLAGVEYGRKNLLRVALLHLPFVRWFSKPVTNDEENGSTPFCSQAVSAALRIGGGVDPVLLLADKSTEPGDLARSPFLEYVCTLEG